MKIMYLGVGGESTRRGGNIGGEKEKTTILKEADEETGGTFAQKGKI